MKLSDLVTADRVVVPLAGESTLPAAARPLVERLIASGAVAREDVLRERMAEERPEDIVAWSDRAFLLHYRTDAVRELAVVLGLAAEPVTRDLGEGDEQRARVVLLAVAPPRAAARYLQVVGAFARLLSREETVAELLAAPTAEAVAALPMFGVELPEQLAVRDVMTERPRTVRGDMPLRDAALEMVRWRLGGLPVVDDEDRLIGLLSERELLRHLLSVNLLGGAQRPPPPGGAVRRLVRDVMTRHVLCVAPEQPLAEVAALLANKDVDRVPVVRNGRLLGVLTRGDIVRKLIGS